MTEHNFKIVEAILESFFERVVEETSDVNNLSDVVDDLVDDVLQSPIKNLCVCIIPLRETAESFGRDILGIVKKGDAIADDANVQRSTIRRLIVELLKEYYVAVNIGDLIDCFKE